MKRVINTKAGFSIVELMMGILASSIMALAVGSILYYAWLGWAQNSAAAEMQRDASISMRFIAREIHRSAIDDISAGATLTCTHTNGTYTFVQNGGTLEMQFDGQSVPLVRDILTKFNTTISNRAVIVELDLSTGSDISENKMTIFTRN